MLFRSAYKMKLIAEGEAWMEMIPARNISSHAYDKAAAEKLTVSIGEDYLPLFVSFENAMETL